MFTVLNMLTCVPHFNRPGFPWQAALRLWFLGRVPISLPLNSVIRADQMAIQMEGWLNAYREGGYLSSWTAPGDRGAMTGNTQDASVADTIVKNVKGFDAALAYQAIVGDTFNVSEPCRSKSGHCKGLGEYKRLGYTPTGHGIEDGVYATLNYALAGRSMSFATAYVGGHANAATLHARSTTAWSARWDGGASGAASSGPYTQMGGLALVPTVPCMPCTARLQSSLDAAPSK